MLQQFRDRMGSYGKWLMALFAIPFALFGVQSFFSHFGANSSEQAATVNGEAITKLEVRQAVQRQRSQIMARFRDIDPSLIDDKVLEGPALQNLIITRAYADRAHAEGMGVSPELIAQLLKEAPAFQQDGKFAKNQYLAYLTQLGYTPQSHSRFLARELLATQLARGVASTGFTTGPELDRAFADGEQARDFRYLTIPATPESSGVDEAAMRAYYDAHPELYVVPENVVVNYIELSLDQIAAAVAIDDTELAERYQHRAEAAEAASQRIVAQIFIKPRVDGSHRKLLDEVQSELAKGADFAQLARLRSEDPLTADQGGELGPYDPEKYPETIRSALDQLPIGGVTPPIESEVGWHVFKMVRVDKPVVGSFAEERAALADELRKEKAGERFQNQVEHLRESAYAAENLDAVATVTGLPVQTSGAIAREGGEGIASNRKVVDAAFAEEVFKGGYISPVVELDQGHALVLQVKERVAQRRQAFADVQGDIARALAAERGLTVAHERATDYRKRALAGESLEKIAMREHLDWKTGNGVRRFDKEADTDVARRVFEVPRAATLPVTDMLDTATGVVVFEVTAIRDGDVAAAPEERRRQLETAVLEARAGSELNAYQTTLLASAKVVAKSQTKSEPQ